MTSQVTAMSELTRLPASVLIHIISLLDNKTVKNLRLACKELSGFANRVLFRTVLLYNKPDSCRLLKSVLSQPHLREEVLKLNLHTVEVDYVSLSC
jgi:DNA mismatch repair ATPase MutS